MPRVRAAELERLRGFAARLDSSSMSGELHAQIKKYNVLDMSGRRDCDVFVRPMRKLLEGLQAHYPQNIPAVACKGEPSRKGWLAMRIRTWVQRFRPSHDAPADDV